MRIKNTTYRGGSPALRTLAAVVCGVALVVLQGCSTFDDMTTYFNIYYNAQRIMSEIEDPEPVEAVGQLTMGQQQSQGQKAAPPPKQVKPPEYFDELIRNPTFDAAKRVASGTVSQKANASANIVKLDSVVNKCTKILKFHSNSSYVPPALYMLAKAFYHKGKQTDFLFSKQKAQEFIQTFPEHELSVDAHLLLAEDLIALKDNEEARRALSRCVDVALPRKRYDVVTKSLRYTADLAMQRGDLEGAVRPYLHAMMLSHNSEANATWQLEIATLNLIVGHDADAAQAFRDVMKYDPDLATEFSSQFGLGVALRQLHQYDAAQKQLEHVRDKGAYSQWKPYAEMELATVRWVRGEQPEAAEEYHRIDTANVPAEVSTRAQYEWGMRAMLAGDYGTAKLRFEKVRATMVTYSKEAERLYNVLVVGDVASRSMIVLEAKLAGTDTGMTAPVVQRSFDTLKLAQAPIVSIETGKPPPGFKPDSISTSAGAINISPDSLAQIKNRRDSIAAASLAFSRMKTRDSVRNALTAAYYDVARMYYLLGHEDSMIAYYHKIIAVGGTSDAVVTTLYSYALYLREKGLEPAHVDTLMQSIVETFPKSKFAPMARMHLGLTDDEKIDSALNEYVSGERFLAIHDDSTAIVRFLRVASLYPASEYAPQALYTVGWIFENNGARYDSARFYYAMLLKLYPNSEHAKRVRPLLAMGTADSVKPPQPNVPATVQPASGAAVISPALVAPSTAPAAAAPATPNPGAPLPPGTVIRNNPRFPSRGMPPGGPVPLPRDTIPKTTPGPQ